MSHKTTQNTKILAALRKGRYWGSAIGIGLLLADYIWKHWL